MAKTKIAPHSYVVAEDALDGSTAIGARIDHASELAQVAVSDGNTVLGVRLDEVGLIDLETTLRHLRYSIYGRKDQD